MINKNSVDRNVKKTDVNIKIGYFSTCPLHLSVDFCEPPSSVDLSEKVSVEFLHVSCKINTESFSWRLPQSLSQEVTVKQMIATLLITC